MQTITHLYVIYRLGLGDVLLLQNLSNHAANKIVELIVNI